MTTDLSKIPPELKTRSQWVVWRIENRDGKPTKVPYNPKEAGRKAESNNPETWGTFNQAVKYYEAHKTNGIAGIGYEFSYYDPYTGCDWDDCRDPETGQLKYCAQVLIEYFSSYGEASPSGTGIHIILEGKLPPGAGSRKPLNCGGKIEVYDVGRYFTVTGQHLEGTPSTIQDRDKVLKAFHAQVIAKPKPPPKSSGPSPTLDLSDQELIEKAHRAANGEKFAKLWRGDVGEYGNDDNWADLALCSMLAFWTGPDLDRIDRLFRQSRLIRGKWDRPTAGSTYGAITIEKALSQITEFYTPGQRPQDPDPTKPKCTPKKAATEAANPFQTITPVIPIFPEEVMTGAAGEFARCYASYLETPKPFLFLNYLTLLGHLVSDKITLASEIAPQPRLYTVNLGESSDTRKTTSINKVHSFFLDVVKPEDMNLIWGVGSAEGLAKAFSRYHRGVLVLDELKALVQKMRIDSSVLLPCINTLFELNLYHSLTKNHDIKIDNAELCLLAASTLDTYRNMFTPQFLDIGFLNRIFIIIGESERKFAIPQLVPEQEKETLRSNLREVLKFVGHISHAGRHPLPLTSEARDIFESWYFSQEKSAFAKRLDTYGHRIMILLAVNDMQATITPEIAERTVALLNYQLAARMFADPIDADNAIARLEEKIRRLLANGPMLKRDLEKHGHKHRVGHWQWNIAIGNLLAGKEIFFDSKTNLYSRVSE